MKKIVFISIIAATLCSCATIVHGGRQNITFNSTPVNATITDNGIEIGKTPLTASLQRNKEHLITIEMQGYKPYQIILSNDVDLGWGVVGNIFSWNLLGIIVDYASGALYKLSPNNVHANFGSSVAQIPEDGSLLIAVTMSPDPSWEKIGQLERE